MCCIQSSRTFSVIQCGSGDTLVLSGFLALLLPLTLIRLMEIDIEERFSVVLPAKKEQHSIHSIVSTNNRFRLSSFHP